MLIADTASQARYDSAMQTAAINENVTAQTQKVLDALAQNKIDALEQQVNALQLQNAVAGVVRYPDTFAYNAGTNPFCGCGNSCGCNI